MLNVSSMTNGIKTWNSFIGLQCQFIEFTENLTDCDWGHHGKHGAVGEGPHGLGPP